MLLWTKPFPLLGDDLRPGQMYTNALSLMVWTCTLTRPPHSRWPRHIGVTLPQKEPRHFHWVPGPCWVIYSCGGKEYTEISRPRNRRVYWVPHSLIHCLGEGLLCAHDLVYHRASKIISLLPPALLHSKVSVEEEGPIRVHEQ